jgi:hypothetical protein
LDIADSEDASLVRVGRLVFFSRTTGLLNLTIGVAIANATTAVGFWLGNSAGSQKKDDVIGAALGAGGGAPVPV